MKKMYSAVVNSPKTELASNIDAVQTVIPVLNSDVFEDTKIAVIGNGETAETIRYASISNNQLIGCERGFQGVAKPWVSGTRLARNFTADDWNTAKENIEGLYDRLDTAATDPLTLQPGLQVIKAKQDTLFSLGEIKGKSEINGQGRIGIVGVENPYVMQTSGNLLPPFYEWTSSIPSTNAAKVNFPYSLSLVATTNSSETFYYFDALCSPNTEYSIKNTSTNGFIKMVCFDENGQISVPDIRIVVAPNSNGKIITPASAKHIRVHFTNSSANSSPEASTGNTFIGTFNWENPSLSIGIEPKPFIPQSKSMLAFQTELHANPTDGSDPDVLFEQDGQFLKLPKWKKVVLDGSLDWKPDPATNIAGIRTYYVRDGSLSIQSYVMWATKYDGTALTNRTVASFTDSDQCLALGNGIHFSVKNADSGIGADVSPTTAEIGAYFFGFKMAHVDGTTPFTVAGEAVHGAKCWIPIAGFTGGNGNSTLPTTFSAYALAAGWMPYNLLYRLAKDTVEQVVTEGALTLHQGDNVVEVGTGIVLRERLNPVNLSSANTWAIVNHIAAIESKLKNKVDKFVSFQKDGLAFYGWNKQNVPASAYGNFYLDRPWSQFDQSSAYSATYIKLDKSPILPISGFVSTNEKAHLADLTTNVSKALTRVSVVEQKKAEKDSPIWLIPTLLNGVVHGSNPVGYKKLSNGLVLFRGIFVATTGVVFMRLPVGYRPRQTVSRTIMALSSGSLVHCNLSIQPDGYVSLGYIGTDYMSLDGVIFEAEQ